VAFGAPRFLAGLGVGDCSGVAVGEGDGVSDGETGTVSKGCGDGEAFFFRCGDVLGDGVGVGVSEVFFFLEAVDGGSSSVDRACFFLGEAVGDGVGVSFSRGVDDFLGVGVGLGDFFFGVAAPFFFRGFGVDVGVEKIFFNACPSVCSAASTGGAAMKTHIKQMNTRRNM
jgi:hypothetical protein